VQKKDTKQLYALKYINKDKCIKMKAVHNIIQERRLLEEIDYPLIVNLRYAFQVSSRINILITLIKDDENMFMVLDLKMGGDVRFHLDRTGPMSQELVRVYVAEIASAIRYLHERKIVHRYGPIHLSLIQ
jgi:serine/threonine kinase 32